MEKKQGISKEEMRQLVESHSWIKSPFAYTKLGANLSLVQQQSLLMVSDHLQTYIKDFYNLKLDKSKKRPKSLFTEHLLKNGIPPFRIYLADLGVQAGNYRDVRKAINEMAVMVEHPVLDDDGIPTGETAFNPVFEEFRVKETGDYYHYERENEEGLMEMAESVRHYGYIDVQINPKGAEWAFDMSAGYVNHLKLIARYSTKRPTPRLYLMLMRAIGQGKKRVRYTLQELKEYLGIVPYVNEKGETVTPYPKFAHFRIKVLDAVRDDLDRMAKLNQTDIRFEYELIYPGSRKRGEPEYIEFKIERTQLGDAYNVIVNHQPSEIRQQPRQQELFMEEYREKFKQCMEEMAGKVKDDSIKAKLQMMQFEHFDTTKKVLYLQLPDSDYYQWIESDNVIRFVWSHLSKHFGKNIQLQYRLLKSSPKP